MIINIYKEPGWTSFDVVARLRRLLKTKKIGHAGTLDPLAEGVLLVLTDQDTKRQDEFMHLEKEYLAEIAFGASTETYDLEGELIFSKTIPDVESVQEQVQKILPKFVGSYMQTVPPYSAVKVKGKRLYKKAREGKTIFAELPQREVMVKSLVIERTEEKMIRGTALPVLTMRITCEKGFYVRSLANDLGKELKTGAVLARLIRTRAGTYGVESARRVSSFE